MTAFVGVADMVEWITRRGAERIMTEMADTIQPSTLCTSVAQASTATKTSHAPGSSGKTMPSRPTAMMTPTSTSAGGFIENLRLGQQLAATPANGAAAETASVGS